MAKSKKHLLDQRLRDRAVVEKINTRFGDTIRILWASRLPVRDRVALVEVYGPTLTHVQEHLDVFVYYSNKTPKIYDSIEPFVARGLENAHEIRSAMERHGSDLEKYFELYYLVFGYHRVSWQQLGDTLRELNRNGVSVPSASSVYTRFLGYGQFLDQYVDWLRQPGKRSRQNQPQEEHYSLVPA